FAFNDLKAKHCNRIQFLSETARSQTAGSAESMASLYHQLIYVFLRATIFIHDAGYKELAVSAWQALLELSFSRPAEQGEASAASVMESFQDFWESEVARIGEDNAVGWATYERRG